MTVSILLLVLLSVFVAVVIDGDFDDVALSSGADLRSESGTNVSGASCDCSSLFVGRLGITESTGAEKVLSVKLCVDG